MRFSEFLKILSSDDFYEKLGQKEKYYAALLRRSEYIKTLILILEEDSELRDELDHFAIKIKKDDEIRIRGENFCDILYYKLVQIDINKNNNRIRRGARISRFLNKTLPRALKYYINLKDKQDNLYVSLW